MLRLFFPPAASFAAIGLAALVAAAPSPYVIMSPGGTYDIEPRLNVPAEYRREMGHLAFTAVYAQPATWGEVVSTYFRAETQVVPADQVRPHGMTQEELNELNKRLIEESKPVAAAVALREAGYEATIEGDGAEVMATLPGMPAAEHLRPGDVIVDVAGQEVETAGEAVQIIRGHTPGDSVSLVILRDAERQRVSLRTQPSPQEPERPAIGASIQTRGFDVDLPFPVTIDTDTVGGSSAGLLFALGVFDAVTDGVLTQGKFVAGTGTIGPDGDVGAIGGTRQKVIAAEQAGADLFLVPEENADEIDPSSISIRVEAVDTFAEALHVLCSLEPREGNARPEPCTQRV